VALSTLQVILLQYTTMCNNFATILSFIANCDKDVMQYYIICSIKSFMNSYNELFVSQRKIN